jgi:cytochrome c-type biogenesis protein CcsB
MLNSFVLDKITFIYFFAFLLYLVHMVVGWKKFGALATIVTMTGFVGHTIGGILRWYESYQSGIGHAPLSNMYESLIFFAWAIILLYIFMEFRTKSRSIGTFATPLAFLCMAYASFDPNMNQAIQPLLPALQSNWLIAHVMTCFFGYAAFAISFGLSIMFLIKRSVRAENKRLFLALIPPIDVLDELSYQMVVIGFLLLSLGIITGSVWAHSAWGTYWAWDPKETWSLITWFIYAVFLHLRLTVGWKGKSLATTSIIGFVCVLFTYFGVNYLGKFLYFFESLHSYA